ncbi:MAG: FtsX-like permease family protein, partial [Rikenellaceae bacterium]
VETTSCCANLPIHLQSGNNISVPGSERENFNVADMYFASNGYMKLFEIPIIDGSNFTEDPSITNEIMVSRSFVKKMEQMEGWTDGAVGKAVLITEHSNGPNDIFTICGVYDDYLIGSYEGQDTRPSIQFYGGDSMESTNAYMSMDWLLIKFKEITPENIASVNKIIKEAYPDGNEHVTLYSNEVVDMYKKSLEVKNSIAIAGVIVLLITLIGLIGYTEDEINRRRSEIAMRKINGASLLEILKLFYTNVLKIAIPAVIVGGMGAYFASESMLKLYTKKIELSWWIFASSLFLILLLISVVILVKTYNAANANPIKNIRTN